MCITVNVKKAASTLCQFWSNSSSSFQSLSLAPLKIILISDWNPSLFHLAATISHGLLVTYNTIIWLHPPPRVWASDKTLLMKESLLKATLQPRLCPCQQIMVMPHFPPLTMGYISLRGSCQHTPAVVNNEEFVCWVNVSNSSICYN